MGAQDISGGIEAMGFSRIVRSATRAGMAHSGAASVSQRGAFAPFSMVPFQGGVMDASFSFSRWNPQGMPASHFALGAAGLLKGRYGISGSAVYQTGAPEGGFAPSDLHISLGVARGLSEHFSFGFGGHFVSSKLTASDRLSGFALDASVAFRTGGFSALVGLTQLGSASLGDDVYPMASSVTLAVSYGHNFGDHRVEGNVDADFYLARGVIVAGGLQYSWRETAFVRGGYHWASKDAVLPSFATVGAGARVHGVTIDAAFLLGGPLSGTMTFGVGYGF